MPRPRIYERPTKTVLARSYRTNTDEEIADIHGCTKEAVKQWRRAYGIVGIRRCGEGLGAPRQFDRPSKDALRLLTEKNTDQEIADMFGCSRRAIGKWRVAYGLEKTTTVYRRRPWAYSLDEEFFRRIDSEKKAYILGLLATDGCIATGKNHSNRVFLCLQARDEHILQEILRAMQSTSPIHSRPKGSFPGSGPMKYIAVSSPRLVADLAKLGVVPRKSLVLTYAKVPARFERHYVRGLFDGDGSMHPKIFSFLGTEALIDGVIDAVYRHTGVRIRKVKTGRLYRASGYAGSVSILHWMYRKSTICLHRKRAIYEKCWT
jgi:hypothetical protein